MSVGTEAHDVVTLDQATDELQALGRITATQIGLVSNVFQGLTRHTDTLLSLAAAIVGSVAKENIGSVLSKVQALAAAAKRFIEDRLQATTGTLEAVTTEVELLRQLSLVTQAQEAISFEIKVLSGLTSIEVAHLGAVGAGFQYLAKELADFSKYVNNDTRELAGQMENRRVAIEETKRVLSAELPRQRQDLARIEADLGDALAVVDSSMARLSNTPVQFKMCVEDISRQIAGVVAAIQSEDITRQQTEHVQEALVLIAAKMCGAENSEMGTPGNGGAQELPLAYAGLTIQIYQLRTIKETVASWTSQIRTCMTSIVRISASDVAGIAPMVLEQEREVSSQLTKIERLERESQACSARIQSNVGGLSNLMQLVSEHVQRSKSIGDRLRLLAFNSIIESEHLGTQAGAIWAISKSIKEVSAKWHRITDQSEQTLQEILSLGKQTNVVMETLSEASSQMLREAQTESMDCLENLRTAAASVAAEAGDMQGVTDSMQGEIAHASSAGDLLETCFDRFDAVLEAVEGARRQLEIDLPGVKECYDAAEVERLFSASYTTEMERDVLHAALNGTTVPVMQPAAVGNNVELF
jgi:hypothetical protein